MNHMRAMGYIDGFAAGFIAGAVFALVICAWR